VYINQEEIMIENMNDVMQRVGHGGMTLDQISEVMGITRERVRQIKESALKKIQLELVRNNHLRKKLIDCLNCKGDI
jgi:DNA-directed RNA polymerase sigma subunit (sigma70/sigma32)